MKSKVKKRCKQMLTGLLALSMLCGLLPQNTVSVSAATTAKTNVSSYGRLGNVDVGSKTKTGTWWKINVGSKTAFCLSLGKTCHGTFVDHTDDRIIMVDEQTHIQLLKLDKETGQALGGAKFVVTDSKGNKVMKFVTKDDAYDITGKLVVGETYTFTEVSAPSGYQLAKPVQLTIKDIGKVQTVTVKDAPIPKVPDTPQTGGNMPVIPIAVGLLMAVGAAVMIWKKRAVVKK